MKALLLRVGIDKGTDGALAPIFKDGSFEYIPISEGDPESKEDRTYRNKYRMFFAEGEGIIGKHIRGNNLEIKLKNSNVEKFVETIINNGFEHHYAFGYNPNRELLLVFCKWLNIETFFI